MNRSDIPFLSAAELADLIQRKEVSPVEATEAYLERIDQVDSKLNAYITVTRDVALAAAREAEAAIAGGGYRGPMHGIPVGVKDQFWTRGIRTTTGSSILADFVPDEDATVMANLKAAGAVLLGKLNMSEYAMAEIFHHPHGTPRNPSRNPGTSSSGSGAATAAFLCATSLGEDTGGSIRTPANWSGLVGLRPSWGRVSRYGVYGGSWSMDQVGPMSRTVEDCAITLQAIAGYDPKDPYTWNVPVPDYRSLLDGNIRGLKVGAITERVHSDRLDPEYREVVGKAIASLGELGATVEEVSIPLTEMSGAPSMAIATTEWAAVHERTFRDHHKELDHNNRIRYPTGRILPAQAYYKAQKIRALLRRQILEALERFDVLVLPSGVSPAPPVESVPGVPGKEQALAGLHKELDHNNRIRYPTGRILPAQAYYKAQKIRALLRRQILEALERFDVLVLPSGVSPAPPVESVPGVPGKEQALAGLGGRASFTGPANLAGTPALSVPCGFTASNLPLGLQIVGRPFDEATVMRVAYAYEQSTEWHRRRPAV